MNDDKILKLHRADFRSGWEANFGRLPADLQDRAGAMLQWFSQQEGVVVAFSGGVDSAVVAGLGILACAKPVVLLTAVGPALAQRQKDFAAEVAQFLAAEHQWLDAGEIEDSNYRRNDRQRCFFCKSNLYAAIEEYSKHNPAATVCNGTNADDLGDYRPGLKAASDYRIESPLVKFQINKKEVRQLAAAMNLPVAELPAAPCLASRIQYGVEVNRQRLEMVERAEAFLWSLNFSDVRIRLLKGEVASVEVPTEELSRLADGTDWKQVQNVLLTMGFSEVLLQQDGLKSGRLNQHLMKLSTESPGI